MTFPIHGPVSAENNPPIVPQYYRPGVYYITAITRGRETIITTNKANQYVVGQQVRFVIPDTYRMIELNGMQAFIQNIIDTTSFLIRLDSSQYNDFDANPSYGPTRPQVMAIGDINSGVPANASGRTNQGTTPPGAFINTSPLEGTWLN